MTAVLTSANTTWADVAFAALIVGAGIVAIWRERRRHQKADRRPS